MKAKQRSSSSAQKLLNRLEQKQDDRVALKALIGRALSRSAKNLHLAVSGGIIAVPIANIEDIVSVTDSQHDVVRVIVRNPHEIQPLLRVKPFQPGSGGGIGNVETARDGEVVPANREYKAYQGVGTCTFTDTDTISGGQGQPDQCDDTVPDNCPPDDTRG